MSHISPKESFKNKSSKDKFSKKESASYSTSIRPVSKLSNQTSSGSSETSPASTAPSTHSIPATNPIRSLYNWTIHWAKTPYATPALGVVSFAESSFFPIPPDPLLMAICFARPKSWLMQALWCTLMSVLGGLLGYWLGWEFKPVAIWILQHVGVPDVQGKFAVVQSFYDRWGFFALIVKSLTPIPFKVFTIASGALHFDLGKFILGAAIGRSIRFILVAGLIRVCGERIRPFLEKRIELVIFIFFFAVIGGFFALKYFGSLH